MRGYLWQDPRAGGPRSERTREFGRRDCVRSRRPACRPLA